MSDIGRKLPQDQQHNGSHQQKGQDQRSVEPIQHPVEPLVIEERDHEIIGIVHGRQSEEVSTLAALQLSGNDFVLISLRNKLRNLRSFPWKRGNGLSDEGIIFVRQDHAIS